MSLTSMRPAKGSTAALVVLVALIVAMLAPIGSTADAASGDTATLKTDVNTLASDQMEGRDNATPGSVMAQNYIIDRIDDYADGLNTSATGDAAYKQHFTDGTNILAVIPGTDLADEYVMIGAHYDHLGDSCDGTSPQDEICNGATDNAAGVAAVLSIGEKIAAARPRRSVILALWDREEDGLLGSAYYTQHPLVPLADTVAYVNYDIAGANLAPSLRNDTIAVGAESGGQVLISAVGQAASPGALDTHELSVIFGQGRSDHVNFLGADIPSVFFTDATGPCYHTAADEPDIVDFPKLTEEMQTGFRLTRDLANTATLPSFVANAPLADYSDAVQMADIAHSLMQDTDLFSAADLAWAEEFSNQLDAIVAAGSGAFSNDDVATVLGGSVRALNILSSGVCDGYLVNEESGSTTMPTPATTVVKHNGVPGAEPAEPTKGQPTFTG